MLNLVLLYVVMVLLKWGYEAMAWMRKNRNGDGISGAAARWWASEQFEIAQKAILTVPLCALWLSGALLGILNATVGQLGQAIAGPADVASAPLFSAVTWQTTMVAAPILDTFGKPWASLLEKFIGAKAPAA